MNLDELKPLWESYKEQTGERHDWSPNEFKHLLDTFQHPVPWYGRPVRILNYVCMSLLLIILTGC